MKHLLTVSLIVVGSAVAIAGYRRSRPQEPFRRTLTFPKAYPHSLTLYGDIDRALERKDYTEAERIVNEALGGPLGQPDPHRNNNPLHEYRARLLARRGADAAALEEYLGLLHNRFSAPTWAVWRPSRNELRPALDAAVRLGRTDAADEIATRIAAEPGWKTDYPGLDPDRPGRTPARRLAHAYLALSLSAAGEMDYAGEVRLCESARLLAPDEVPVLARLADAYGQRNGPGDRERALATFRRAYALLPVDSPTRRDLRIVAASYGDAAGPNAKPTLAETLRAYNVGARDRNRAHFESMEAARAKYQAEQIAQVEEIRARMRQAPASPRLP